LDLSVDEIQNKESVRTICESLGLWKDSLLDFLEEKAGELTHTMVLLFVCSMRNNNGPSNVIEALRTMFEVMGDEEGNMEVQEVVRAFTDLALIHDSIDQILADQVLQFLLGQGFMDSDAEVTSKYDGKTTTNFLALSAAPCLQEWAETHGLSL
jgi:hypothetical protein